MRYAGASRIEASFRRLSSHRRLDSDAARRLCAGAASQLEAAVSCLSSPSLPVQRQGEALEASVRHLSSLSPPGQRRGDAAVRCGAARQLCAGAASRLEAASRWRLPVDSRRSSVASRLIAVWTAARQAASRAAVRWTAARLGSCALAPPLDSRRPSVASHDISVAVGAAARRGSYALDSGVARRLSAGAAFDSRPPPVASRFRRRPPPSLLNHDCDATAFPDARPAGSRRPRGRERAHDRGARRRAPRAPGAAGAAAGGGGRTRTRARSRDAAPASGDRAPARPRGELPDLTGGSHRADARGGRGVGVAAHVHIRALGGDGGGAGGKRSSGCCACG